MKLFCKHKQNELIGVQEERDGFSPWIFEIALTLKCKNCGKLYQIAYQDKEVDNE